MELSVRFAGYGRAGPRKYREVRAELIEAGWSVIRQRGSHEVWSHPDRPQRIVVAGRDSATVPAGTLGSFRKASGVADLRVSDYLVIYEQAADGAWGAYLPDVPGVVALGGTRGEVADGIREALDAYATDLSERGLAMPTAHHSADTIAA